MIHWRSFLRNKATQVTLMQQLAGKNTNFPAESAKPGFRFRYDGFKQPNETSAPLDNCLGSKCFGV